MFAVGALDAYFCDAYTDVVAATIIAKSRQATVALPDFFYDIRFPVRAILEPYDNNENWRWRMAARKMMERETILSLATVQTLFNKFFQEGEKFFGDPLLDWWIRRPDSRKRLFGATRFAYNAMTAADRAREEARKPRRSLSAFMGGPWCCSMLALHTLLRDDRRFCIVGPFPFGQASFIMLSISPGGMVWGRSEEIVRCSPPPWTNRFRSTK
jgi:hypothetical protein